MAGSGTMAQPDLPDHARVADVLIALTHEVVMPRFRALGSDAIRYKGRGDPVTIADVEMEQRLTQALQQILPGSVVVGEEGVADDPAILEQSGQHTSVWLVDPIDGTSNFIAGKDDFCAMVALLIDGLCVMSWIYMPRHATLAFAEHGKGARINDTVLLTPRAPPDCGQWSGLINFNLLPLARRARMRTMAQERYQRLHNLRSAGVDYVQMASGQRQFSLYDRLWPWDHAPGVLLLREAGGHCATLDGFAPYRALDRGHAILSTADTHVWHDVAQFMSTDGPPTGAGER